MDIEIIIDENLTEPKLIVRTPYITEEINELSEILSRKHTSFLCGFKDHKLKIINPSDLIRIYGENKKIYAKTYTDKFLLKHRLYQIADILDNKKFVRISNSEIVNLEKVDHFDLNHVGTICIKLVNGDITYVARRYVSEVKRILGL